MILYTDVCARQLTAKQRELIEAFAREVEGHTTTPKEEPVKAGFVRRTMEKAFGGQKAKEEAKSEESAH